MKPKIDHIQITVKDLKTAEAFYDQLMPLLGFDITKKAKARVAAHDFDVVEYIHADLLFGINSPREAFAQDNVHRRKPGSLHHLAFRAGSTAEVDVFYEALVSFGAHIVETPKYFPQHGEHYYALFFKDPDGIKYEVVYEDRSAMFPTAS